MKVRYKILDDKRNCCCHTVKDWSEIPMKRVSKRFNIAPNKFVSASRRERKREREQPTKLVLVNGSLEIVNEYVHLVSL